VTDSDLNSSLSALMRFRRLSSEMKV